MLQEFVTANRTEIIARCIAKIASSCASRPWFTELECGVPLLVDHLAVSNEQKQQVAR